MVAILLNAVTVFLGFDTIRFYALYCLSGTKYTKSMILWCFVYDVNKNGFVMVERVSWIFEPLRSHNTWIHYQSLCECKAENGNSWDVIFLCGPYNLNDAQICLYKRILNTIKCISSGKRGFFFENFTWYNKILRFTFISEITFGILIHALPLYCFRNQLECIATIF